MQGTHFAICVPDSSLQKGFPAGASGGMGLLHLKSTWIVASVAFVHRAALSFFFFLVKLGRSSCLARTASGSSNLFVRRDQKWVSREIERLCAGHPPNEMIKKMSPEDRVLFEVSVIDALNSRSRESQHLLRSALIKYGYDEQCARRVMSAELSDRVRATSLLTLLRPQWRDEPVDPEPTPSGEYARARAASQTTGSLESD